MLARRPESGERFVRRLESFCDIVLGFSLAELTLTLSLPSRFSHLTSDPFWLIAYLWTFAIVCYLWFEHHRLFARVFAPRTVSILLNFAWLATIGLLVYMVQLYNRFDADLAAVRSIYEWYFAAYAINMLLLSGLYALGLREYAPDLDASGRAEIGEAVLRFGIAGATVLAIVLAAALFLPTLAFFFVVGPSVGYGFIVAALAMRILERRTRRA